MDMLHCLEDLSDKENIKSRYLEGCGGAVSEERKVSPKGKMATVLREHENGLPYDSSDEWEIGVGDLIIDLDADLEKEKQAGDGRTASPDASPLKIGKMKIKRKTSSGIKTDSAKYEISQKRDELIPTTAVDAPQNNFENVNGVCTHKPGRQTPEDKGGKSGRNSGHHKRDSGNRQDRNSNSNRGSDHGQNSGANSGGDGNHGNADGSGGSGRDGRDNNRDGNKDNNDKDDHEEEDENKNEGAKNVKQKHGSKKSKGEKVTVAVGTSDMATLTEPECLAPCEPGTSVNLEGIVWHETDGGVLVVNVTWRNKTYVGTLLDCSKHDWAPPRFCDSPTSDMEVRPPKAGGRGKRGRSNSSTPLMGGDMSNYTETRTSIHSKLRNSNGKGRRGSAAGSRTPTNGLERGKRKSKPMDLDLNSSYDEGRAASKRIRTNSRGTPTTPHTPADNVVNDMPPSPVLIECPEPNCGKKYKHINGLRYHQTHAHLNATAGKMEASAEEQETETKSLSSEDSNSVSVPVESMMKSKTPPQSEYDFSDSNSKNTTVKGLATKAGHGPDGKCQLNVVGVVVKQEPDVEKADSVIKENDKKEEKLQTPKSSKSKHDKVAGKSHKSSEKIKIKDGASTPKQRMKKHVSSGEDTSLEFQAMVENALASQNQQAMIPEVGARKDVVTVAGTVTPAINPAVTSVIQSIKIEPGLKESSNSTCCNIQQHPPPPPPPPSLEKIRTPTKEESRTSEMAESEGPKKKEKEKHKSGDREKHKKSNKADKSVPKLKSARPIAPAPPVPQLIAIPGFAATSTAGGTVTISPVTTNPQATPISPPLIPIQPKPTVMGEPMVNPSLSSLKERKHKSKKKSKDRDKEDKGEKSKDSSKDKESKDKHSKQTNERSKMEETNILKRALTESGILDDAEKSPSPSQNNEPASVFTSSNMSSEPPKAVVAPTRPEIPKLIPSDSVPKSATAHVITSAPKSIDSESIHRHDRQGCGLSNLSANTAAVAPNSHAPSEPLHVITTASQGSSSTNQDARSPAYSDISDANDDISNDCPKQCDDPYQFNDDSQPPAVKSHHALHGEMRKERDEVSVYAPYSSSLTSKMHSPSVLEGKKRPSEESLKYLQKDSEKQRKDAGEPSESSEHKKAKKDETQEQPKLSSTISQFPEQQHPSPKMIPQQMYPQYPYMPGYMGYSIDRTYHMHLMATDPHYRHQHEKFMEEQERMRQEHERAEWEKREKAKQEKPPRTPEKETEKLKTEQPTPSKSTERKEARSSEQENWQRGEERMNERMKEKQRENHQIMAESIELKSQVGQPPAREPIYDARVLYERRQREDIRQHYLYQQKVLEQQRYEDERRRQQQSEKEKRERSESKSSELTKETPKKDRPVKETQSKSEKESKPLTKVTEPLTKVTEEKKEDREQRKSEEKSHQQIDSKPHHHEVAKFPDGYPAYMQHPFMQSAHYSPVPFDPNHPAYRPVNPIMTVQPSGFPGTPYLPPEFRYSGPATMVTPTWKMTVADEKAIEHEREREREREQERQRERAAVVSPLAKSPHTGTSRHTSPERPPKALELLQHHASQYYNSQHKGESRSSSEDRSKTVSPARPTSRSPAHKPHSSEGHPSKGESSSQHESGICHEMSPPMQRHLHTHHHTHHVGMGYPIMAAPYDPYAAVLANTQAAAVASISPYTARRE